MYIDLHFLLPWVWELELFCAEIAMGAGWSPMRFSSVNLKISQVICAICPPKKEWKILDETRRVYQSSKLMQQKIENGKGYRERKVLCEEDSVLCSGDHYFTLMGWFRNCEMSLAWSGHIYTEEYSGKKRNQEYFLKDFLKEKNNAATESGVHTCNFGQEPTTFLDAPVCLSRLGKLKYNWCGSLLAHIPLCHISMVTEVSIGEGWWYDLMWFCPYSHRCRCIRSKQNLNAKRLHVANNIMQQTELSQILRSLDSAAFCTPHITSRLIQNNWDCSFQQTSTYFLMFQSWLMPR